MRYGAMGLVASATLLALPVHAADKKCSLQMYGELPVTMRGTQPHVSGTVNGVEAVFLADSGAFFSTLTPQSASKFNLKMGMLPNNFHVGGTGGIDYGARLGTAKDFSLVGLAGGQVVHNVDFVVSGTSLPMLRGVAGIIGENLLGASGNSDTEYDLGKGVIRVLHAKDCGDNPLAYWRGNGDYAMVEIDSRDALHPHIVGPAMLNGKKIRVVFDTGASRSILNLRAAERVGLKLDSEELVSAGIGSGIGKRVNEVSTARFEEFDIGGEKIKNARLNVRLSNFEISNGADMLLGADFFLSHRIYVSAKQHKVYFTYNGGKVFDLGAAKEPDTSTAATAAPHPDDVAATTATTDAATDTATTAAAATTKLAIATDPNAPKDAAGYRLRGAAFAGRQDYPRAIADFDRAIELDANDAESYYQRGAAKRRNRQPLPALADFDQALKLKPDHIQALMERGAIRLAGNNLQGARTDFDTAGSLSPNDPTLGLEVAQLYASSRHYNEAIDRYDLWLSTHRGDDRAPTAWGGRCWSRTLANKDLDTALEDCNTAIKKGPTNSQFLDYRAVLLLKRGELDKSIKDFNASLKLQPRNPLTLYGLGAAQVKRGAKSEGEKNMQAAVAINPQIGEFYKRQNLAP